MTAAVASTWVTRGPDGVSKSSRLSPSTSPIAVRQESAYDAIGPGLLTIRGTPTPPWPLHVDRPCSGPWAPGGRHSAAPLISDRKLVHAEAAPITIVPANDDRDRAIRLAHGFSTAPPIHHPARAKINHMIAEQAPGIPFHWDKAALVQSKDVLGVASAYSAYITTHDLTFASLKR